MVFGGSGRSAASARPGSEHGVHHGHGAGACAGGGDQAHGVAVSRFVLLVWPRKTYGDVRSTDAGRVAHVDEDDDAGDVIDDVLLALPPLQRLGNQRVTGLQQRSDYEESVIDNRLARSSHEGSKTQQQYKDSGHSTSVVTQAGCWPR